MTGERIDLLRDSDLRRLIKQKLKTGWVVILGDPELVQFIEDGAYPPGTKENELFQLLAGPSLLGFCCFLAKKTERLSQVLGNPPDMDTTICLEIMGQVEEGLLVDQVMAKEGQLDSAIDKLIAKILKGGKG